SRGKRRGSLCTRCAGQAARSYYGSCGYCGSKAVIRFINLHGIGVGSCCYHEPIERCSECGLDRPITFRHETAEGVCAKCYRKKFQVRHRCSECRRVGAAMAFIDAKAICGSCYEKNHRPKARCGVCGRVAKTKMIVAEIGAVCERCYRRKYR